MSEGGSFLPYEVAKKIVGNVIEEEHLHDSERRVLTVYDLKGRALCWFDADEVIADVAKERGVTMRERENDELKVAAVDYVLRRIPDWVLDEEA